MTNKNAKARNTPECEPRSSRLRLAQFGSEAQKCIGEHERESMCEPWAHPDSHVLSMSWQAGMSVPPIRAFPPFLRPQYLWQF